MNRHITGMLAVWLGITGLVQAQVPGPGPYPTQSAMYAPVAYPPTAPVPAGMPAPGMVPAGGAMAMPMMGMGIQPAGYPGCVTGDCAVPASAELESCGPGGCGMVSGGLPNWFQRLHTPCPQAHGYDGFNANLCNHGPSGDGGCCLPRWFDVQAEWLYWQRDDPNARQFSSLGILGPNALDAADLDFSQESGFRVTGAYLIGPSTGVELGYFGGFNWADSAQATSNADLFSLFSDFGSQNFNGSPDTDSANLHRLSVSSELDNVELNVRRRWVSANCVVHTSILGGARYFRFREDLSFITETNSGMMDYTVNADNDLVGAQLGGDLFLCLTPRFRIGAEAKGGIFGASNSQKTNVAAAVSSNINEYAKDNDVAFVGEAGATALYRVTSHLTFRVGYQLLYVDGVATALDNVDTQTPFSQRIPFVNNSSDLFWHGSNVGFEYTW